MNFSGILGMLAAIGIAAFAILETTSNPKIFADVHGIVIVIGGTVTVALLSFTFKRLSSALKIVAKKMFSSEMDDYNKTIALIVTLAEAYRTNPKSLEQQLPKDAHPFIRDATQMICNYGFNIEELDDVLTNSMKGKVKRDEEELKVWHTVARFPPAFGLLGATLGMIALLQTLGEPGAQAKIGPAMATALVATFYGLVVANLVLIPIAEKLAAVGASDRVMRQIIKDGMILIVEKKHPTYIEEFLRSFLAPGVRTANSSAQKSGQGGSRAA